MAVVSLRDHVQRLLSGQLSPKLRYRCLLLQTADVQVLKEISRLMDELIADQGGKAVTFHGKDQFDTVSAVSCQQLLEKVKTESVASHVILLGPLVFLDFWSQNLRHVFWEHLATVMNGPGIIVLDSPRERDIEDTFRILGKIPGTDVRYLKSRLAVTQDGLV